VVAGADAPIRRGVTTKEEDDAVGFLAAGVAAADATGLGVADATGVLMPGGGAMGAAGVAALGVAAMTLGVATAAAALGVVAATLGVATVLVLAADKAGRVARLTNPPVAGVRALAADSTCNLGVSVTVG